MQESPSFEVVGLADGSNKQKSLTQETGIHIPCKTDSLYWLLLFHASKFSYKMS